MTRFRVAIWLLMAVMVSACGDAQDARLFAPETTPYDGVWIGQLSVGFRTAKCKITRTGIRTKIAGGIISGKVRYRDAVGQLSGVLNQDGSVRGFQLDGGVRLKDVRFEGQFATTVAKGNWSHKECSGGWILRKAR